MVSGTGRSILGGLDPEIVLDGGKGWKSGGIAVGEAGGMHMGRVYGGTHEGASG